MVLTNSHVVQGNDRVSLRRIAAEYITPSASEFCSEKFPTKICRSSDQEIRSSFAKLTKDSNSVSLATLYSTSTRCLASFHHGQDTMSYDGYST